MTKSCPLQGCTS